MIRTNRRRSPTGGALAAALYLGAVALAAAPVAAVDISLSGTWTNNNFGSTGATGALIAINGDGHLYITLTTDHLFGGYPGNFQLALVCRIDPATYSCTGTKIGDPNFGNVTFTATASGQPDASFLAAAGLPVGSDSPDGGDGVSDQGSRLWQIEGSATNVPELDGGRVDFTGAMDLSSSPKLDLDMSYALRGFSSKINTVWRLQGGQGCVPNDLTLCLNQGRFRVRITWTKPDSVSGDGNAVPFGSDDSGMMWFFDSANWEILIKVLNGCGLNSNYWVFFAATTNVEFTVTVTDTQSNTERTFTNPQGQPANAVTDTSAFATCP